MLSCAKTWRALMRRKAPSTTGAGGLARVLGTLDLTALGVGSTLGVGVYVLAGFVSRDEAGPGVVLSFLVAAVASVFAGLCYAEFGARVPRAGSAYVYSYVTVGEFIAFIIGWNLILEYVIGAASVVRALSSYIDSLAGDVIQNAMREAMPMNVSFLSPYPDFFAFGLTTAFSVALAFGAKESSSLNNLFTLINLTVVLYVVITGCFKADAANWRLDPASVDPVEAERNEWKVGDGGFLPFGLGGVMKGAATCFYGFIGFDCVATTGEEAKNPQKSIPIAIVASLFIVFLAYFGVSTVLTMMWPYYDQHPTTPLPYVYDQLGWPVARWIVSVGAVFGLFSSLMGALYPLPRIIYAMSSDGLLFAFLGWVHPRFQTPLIGTLLAGLLTGSMALLFNLDQLANMMAIGTLLAYSIVAACVLLLRYAEEAPSAGEELVCAPAPADDFGAKSPLASLSRVARQLVNWEQHRRPTPLSAAIVTWATVLFSLFCFAAASCVVFAMDSIVNVRPLIAVLIISVSCLLLLVFIISLQPYDTNTQLSFKVPLVPFLPALSILINISLMLMLDVETWIRFIVWIVIGFAIYFSYGIWHSHERPRWKPSRTSAYGGTDNNANPKELQETVANP